MTRAIKFRTRVKADHEGAGTWQYFEFPSTDEEWFGDLDPETWCQWTGLLDKNGKEIYEDDFLRLDNGTDAVVYGAVKFVAPIYRVNGFRLDEKWATIEIKGNVHENPDLLK